MVQALRNEVVPWLENNVPSNAGNQRRMEADPRVPGFTVVFDREGYSPDLFAELNQRQIAVLSYHRYPAEDWPVEEFQEQALVLSNGETGHPCAQWAVDARGAEADWRWSSGGLDQHQSEFASGPVGGVVVRAVGSGELLPLHAATLCPGSTC